MIPIYSYYVMIVVYMGLCLVCFEHFKFSDIEYFSIDVFIIVFICYQSSRRFY
jgi:hypothetical protein